MHRKIVKVFLASPGDLKAEREAAHRVVNEINRNSADFWNIQIDLIGWEDTVSKFGRAQEVINQELDQCEYFIGILWQKWGSPPGGDDHPYTSGFEEEFRRSVDRREKSGSPEISLLFKAPEASRLEDPGQELTKVLNFRKEVISSKKILFQEFSETSEFEARVRAVLTDYAQKIIIAERESAAPPQAVASSPISELFARSEDRERNELLPAEASAFIESLISRSDPDTSVTPADIARFRLIAKAAERVGNDDETVGIHDANAIFRYHERFDLTALEVDGLVEAGLKNLNNEVVPLWRWLCLNEADLESSLGWRFRWADATTKANVLKVLTRCGMRLDTENLPLPREQFIRLWLADKSDEVKFNGMDYLAELGSLKDIELLRPSIESTTSTVSERALSAAIVIASRLDPDEALAMISRYPAISVSMPSLKRLFQNPAHLQTESLQACLAHRSTDVREKVLIVLFSRSAISKETANTLLNDNAASIRNLALRYLMETGHKFSVEDARKILVRTNRQSAGLLFFGQQQTEGTDFFEAFKLNALQDQKIDVLRGLAEDVGLHDHLPILALYSGHFKTMWPEIARHLSDGFSAEINRRIAKLGPEEGVPADLIRRLEDQSATIKKELIEGVLEIVCQRGSAPQIDVVRTVIDKFQPVASVPIITYLEKYGAWEDVKRIADLGGRRGKTLLDFSRNDFLVEKAHAILKLGKARLADVVGLKVDALLLAEIIASIPNPQFKALSDAAILKFLSHGNEKVRRGTALKAVLSSGKQRATLLLKAYLENDQQIYYNVVHWLDLGASAPVHLAKKVALRELAS